jgi:hypothetical protein
VILLTVVPASAKKYTLHLGEEITLSGHRLIYGGSMYRTGAVLYCEDKQGNFVQLAFGNTTDKVFYIGRDKYVYTDYESEAFFFQDENEPDESWFGWFE